MIDFGSRPCNPIAPSTTMKIGASARIGTIYEQMIQAPQQTVDAVAGFVGLQEPAVLDPSRVDVAPQRDALSQAWRERFVAEAKDLGFFSN